MNVFRIGIGAALLVVTCAQAAAQSYGYQNGDAYDNRPVHWHVDAGYAATTGRTADYLVNGWTFGGGLTFTPRPGSPVSLRADLGFSQFNATNHLITLGEIQNQTYIDDGTGRVVNLDVDAVFHVPLGPRVRAYILGGIGAAYRRIELTQTVGFAGYYCDPWYGYCGIGFEPGDLLIHSEETTRFAWNAGVGVEFPWYNGQGWFIEARYNRVETPVPTEFVPIRVGIRF